MKKQIGLITAIFSILLIVIFFDRLIGFIVTVQWFKEVDYLPIYFTRLTAALRLMVPLFLIFYVGIWIYYKSIRKNILKVNKVIEVNTQKKKLESRIFVVGNLVSSFLLSYFIAFNYWYQILLFTNSTSFNTKDPIFNMDISFYVFKLPLIQSFYSAFFGLIILMIIVTIGIYLITSAKDRISNMDIKNPFSNIKAIQSGLTRFAGKQLAVLSSLVLLMISIGYLLKSYYLLYSPRGYVFGANYTDIKVSLVYYRIIMIVSLVAAIVVFISILMSKVKPIIISIILIFGLIILEGTSVVLAQRFFVDTNQISFEEPYIRNNIEYTRKAYKLDSIVEKQYSVNNTLTKEDIKNNREIIDNIKVNSFKPALDFYNQVQFTKYYYAFNDVDIDRYEINGKMTQVFISPREIIADSIEPNTWQNRHLVYTHGYGVVMSKVNSVTPEGQPSFVMKNIPVENLTDIKLDNPRIYFGERTDYYAIVNTKEEEVDYPMGSSIVTNKYNGTAGIRMSLLNRALFSIYKRDSNFLLSQDITSESKILINRNILDRVKKVAPFLLYDSDPYVVIADGSLFWIIDAYTVSDRYPYSQPYQNINYMRNSVKVVVDAFNGDINFYIVDKEDPIIMSYSKIFKGLFKDEDSIPKEIKDHFRYPEGLFNVQCAVLGKYHITDPRVFLTGENYWEIAKNQKKIKGDKTANDAFYVFTRLPEEKKEEMILFEYFNIRDRENMAAMLAVRMDGDNYGEMVLYKFPTTHTVYSPYLFNKKFNQDPLISRELSLWEGKGSTVYYGDTVIVPINNSLLYIEPIYLIAEGKNSIPEMKRVIVAYGEKIALAENVDRALEQLFNYTEDKAVATSSLSKNVYNSDLALKAKELYEKAVEAQKNLDWAKYGEYILKLGEILEELNKQ